MSSQLSQFKISPYVIPGLGITVTSENIMSDVQKFFNVTTKQLASPCRKRELVLPRQVAMYLHNQFTRLGHKRIGFIFNRERTSVLHSVEAIHNCLHSKVDTPEKIELQNFMRVHRYTVKPRVSTHFQIKARS